MAQTTSPNHDMTSSETVDAQMHPPHPVFPSDLDNLVKGAIDRERRGDAYFQDPPYLARGDIAKLLDIAGTIIQAPVPSDIPETVILEATVACATGRFESWVKKCWNVHPEDLDQPERGIVASGSGDSLRSGYHSKYRGNYPQAFVEQLREYRSQYTVEDATKKPYNWSIAVVQSSGMGKSRMIREVSNLVFMIPVNVRERLSSNIATYPPPDHNAREYFLALGPKTDTEVQVHCAVFFTELFKHVRELIPQLKHRSGSELASEWAEYLEDGESTKRVGENRLRLYEEVISRSHKLIARLSVPMSLKGCIHKLIDECKLLKDAIGPDRGDSFYVAFDEAHTLTVPRAHDPTVPKDIERERSIYSNIEKVLTYLVDTPPFFIFLSTNSHLHRLTPSISAHPSSRHIKEDGHVLLPPWTLLPFNVFAQETIDNHGVLTLDEVSKVGFMAGFGRALWHVYYEEEVAVKRHSGHNHLFITACKKLAPGSAELSEKHLAAIGVRVGFSFDAGTTSARELESRMVEQHMRVAIQVPPHREYMVTAALREPVLAEAAGRVCALSEYGVSTLDHYFGRGMLARGERGEVIGRLLLTLAHDEALRSHGFGSSSLALEEPMYHRPVALLDFLLALFHRDYHDTILGAQPTGDPNGASLRKTFENAYIHFSHFGAASDEATLNVGLMFQCLVTGTALQANGNQRSIDAVIPVHLGPTSSPISEATTSSINIQFKNQDDSRPCHVDRAIVIPNTSVPTISLVMELGAKPNKSGVAVAGIGRARSKPPYSSYWDGMHYELVAYGHSADTYNVISEELEPTYARLLATTQLADNHPYPENKRTLELFRPINPGVSQSNLFQLSKNRPACM